MKLEDEMHLLSWKVIGERLCTLRRECGFSQSMVADYLGVDQSHVSKLERGTRHLQLTHLEKLCALYCVDDFDLLCNPHWVPRYNGLRLSDMCMVRDWKKG